MLFEGFKMGPLKELLVAYEGFADPSKRKWSKREGRIAF